MCPECGSEDIDFTIVGPDVECQECGWVGDIDELEEDGAEINKPYDIDPNEVEFPFGSVAGDESGTVTEEMIKSLNQIAREGKDRHEIRDSR